MKVEIVPHNPHWSRMFEEEAQHLRSALGDNVVVIHHIGSTSIPGIYAKPVLDFLIAVHSLAAVDACNSAMETLGYEVMGEYGIAGRRYFRKEADNIRTHNVHVFQETSPQVERHLTFRDYMIAHPDDAQAYSDLKRELAEKFPEDIHGYMDGKDPFIKDMDEKAARWRNTSHE